VTHIVSEHETVQQSIAALCHDVNDWNESTVIVNSAWLSECIKAGQLVDIQLQYRLPSGDTASQV